MNIWLGSVQGPEGEKYTFKKTLKSNNLVTYT